jgi:hypothetical protein
MKTVKSMNQLVAIFTIVFFMLTSFKAEAQKTESKTKLFCVTQSCCSFGLFSVEIWSETTCHYVDAQRTAKGFFNYSMKFKTSEKGLKKLGITEDLLLAGLTSKEGKSLYIPKGTYEVINNEIFFTPIVVTTSALKKRKYCYIREVSGSLFGHDYSYEINVCISFRKNSKRGTISLTPKLSSLDLQKLSSSRFNNEIEFFKDTTIKEDGINYTIKAGKYIVNSDGKIYLQGVKIK